MSEGGYDRAIQLFEKLEARYPYGRFAQQAQLEVAYAYYKQGEQALALAAADRFIKLHPNHQNVDYAYYLKGLVNFNEDLGLLAGLSRQDLSERDPKGAREAFDSFRELTERFPESRYADDSRARMQYLVNSLASHEVHVARYYYNRGAYVAAANRAQTAVSNFPQAPATEEALFLLVKSYDAMGLAAVARRRRARDADELPRQRVFPRRTGRRQAVVAALVTSCAGPCPAWTWPRQANNEGAALAPSLFSGLASEPHREPCQQGNKKPCR